MNLLLRKLVFLSKNYLRNNEANNFKNFLILFNINSRKFFTRQLSHNPERFFVFVDLLKNKSVKEKLLILVVVNKFLRNMKS